ncbi:uncharacterized protein EI97DRAFT_367451 [Westerdykella ornata]|uniref:Uncharacterized protein n=1 Tax=Westerdykella ornata TaxID=318751 RepID=A0A6A6JXV0_WESOR|nr:uncharacterized protein EI97DRAFT_367451 [Westerdykella ornata]KAF2281451.1 hypothetical protein EI97DRAFT_367451 [Westerdykella ornata]
MEDPDRDWKPNGRPQSTIAQNFMAELDNLFKMDGDLDSLDRNVHKKKREVSMHTQQLEALQARLRETEERLKLAQESPPTRKDSQRRSPVQGAFSDVSHEPMQQSSNSSSPTTARRAQHNNAEEADCPTGALSESLTSDKSTEYVMVDRPRTPQKEEDERA